MTDDTITPEELDAMEQRVNAATPGKLVFRGKDSTIRHPGEPPYEFGSEVVARFYEDDEGRAQVSDGDLELWMHARSDLPRLLAAYRALQERYDGEVTGLCQELTVLRRERDALRAQLSEAKAEAKRAHQRAAREETATLRALADLDEACHERDALRAALARAVELIRDYRGACQGKCTICVRADAFIAKHGGGK